jgi:hypothetical protein
VYNLENRVNRTTINVVGSAGQSSLLISFEHGFLGTCWLIQVDVWLLWLLLLLTGAALMRRSLCVLSQPSSAAAGLLQSCRVLSAQSA